MVLQLFTDIRVHTKLFCPIQDDCMEKHGTLGPKTQETLLQATAILTSDTPQKPTPSTRDVSPSAGECIVYQERSFVNNSIN